MKKFLRSFKYAFNGLRFALQSQMNFRVHLFATIIVLALGTCLGLQKWEWAILLIAICLVLMAELFNSALELLTDMVSPDYHIQAGKIKDMAAAAVLITAILAIAIASIILFPKIILFIKQWHAA